MLVYLLMVLELGSALITPLSDEIELMTNQSGWSGDRQHAMTQPPTWSLSTQEPNPLHSISLSCCLGTGVRVQFFTFQISTFDKSGFPHALIIAWKSHHSPYPLVLLPPLRLTHQDEHGQEQNVLNSIVVFQSCPKTTTTN